MVISLNNLDFGHFQAIEKPENFLDFAGFTSTDPFDYVCEILAKQTTTANKLRHDAYLLNNRLTTYIDNKIEIGNTLVSEGKLQDDLFSMGYSRERARELINFIQNSFDGSIRLEDLQEFVEQFSKASAKDV